MYADPDYAKQTVHYASLARLNEGLLDDLAPAVGTLSGLLQEIIRPSGISACDAVENPFKGNFRPARIAVRAGFDHPFSRSKYCSLNEDDHLFFG
jgi:hypothetical protein